MSSRLPNGPLYGHYCCNGKLYTAHHGSPHVVLNSPRPQDAALITSGARIPRFREPRYLSLEFAYLLFVPKHHPFRDPIFKTLDRPRHKLPIIKDADKGYRLHPDVADEWMDLEHCLRDVGRAMIELSPLKWIPRVVNPWFFPGRFKFLRTFETEEAARLAARYSIENFLPLFAYVSFGFWCMDAWYLGEWENDRETPDWRPMVIEKANILPGLLDYLEDSVLAQWATVDRVGALYHVRNYTEVDFSPELREKRLDVEALLRRILHSKFPIPLYLFWGDLPREIHEKEVPQPFHEVMPGRKQLEKFASRSGGLTFSEYYIDVWEWVEAANTAASTDLAGARPATPAVATAPFPTLPPNSRQQRNETIQAFFRRRTARNLKGLMNESVAGRSRRMQREEDAKRGGVPNKAHVFYWEEQDGHLVRLQAARMELEEMWEKYPGPQRRYDSFGNEWDLAEILEKGDPVFGEDFSGPAARDSDHEDHMDFDQSQNLQEFDLDSIEALGGNYGEAEIPRRDGKEASEKCMASVHLRFDLTPRQEEPVYEPIARTLVDALRLRFGFVLPSPGKFAPCDGGQGVFDVKDLGNVVGQAENGSELASHKGLEEVLGVFLGQCTKARSYKDIDKSLLSVEHPPSPFSISREYLRSMLDPAQESFYYVLRRRGGVEIGRDVLLFPRATDAVEVLRQGWGPDLRDVVGHLLARGMTFWHATTSAEIMPATSAPTDRPKRYRPDLTTGLGFRSADHVFDEIDYKAYGTTVDVQLLNTPRGRIALQQGGVIARLARSQVSDEDFFKEFSDDIYDVGDCLWDGTSTHAYWHERLSGHEIDLICGVYHVGTGVKRSDASDQTKVVSWWPKPNAWARGGLDGWWTPRCEDEWFQKRVRHFKQKIFLLPNQSKWRYNLKFSSKAKKCWEGCERVAETLVELWGASGQ